VVHPPLSGHKRPSLAPLLYALEWAERLDPSITYSRFSGKLRRAASCSTAARRLPGGSGSNLAARGGRWERGRRWGPGGEAGGRGWRKPCAPLGTAGRACAHPTPCLCPEGRAAHMPTLTC
jgi:hypothetical protein